MKKKIMLVLLRTLGDVVLLNTLAETVKNYYGRDSHLTVFVNPEWSQIVRNNPTIDRVRDEKNWSGNFYDIQKEMLSSDWDEVLIPAQLNSDDNAWHQYPESREQHLYDFYLGRCRIPKEGGHVVRELRMYPGPHDLEKLSEKLKGINLPKEKVVVLHSTSGNPYKDLSPSQWQKILECLHHEGFHFVQVGHERDIPLLGEKGQMPGSAFPGSLCLDLRGRLSLGEIFVFIREHACAFMGLDSGLSYVAAATLKPVFIWYGCTIPQTSGPWGENVHSLVSKECKTAQERNHVRCHAQCGAKPNCIQQFNPHEAIQLIHGVMGSV